MGGSSAKAKAKLKASVITQQENLLQERHAAMDKLSRELATAQLESDGLREERASLQSRIADQTKKLEESQALLQSNHQMIQWLNQQVRRISRWQRAVAGMWKKFVAQRMQSHVAVTFPVWCYRVPGWRVL